MKLNLKTKLIGGNILVSALILASGIVGIVYLYKTVNSANIVSQEKAPIQYAAMNAAVAISEVKGRAEEYKNAKSNLEPIEEDINKHLADFKMWLAIIQQGTDSTKFKESANGKLFAEKNLNFSSKPASKEVAEIAQTASSKNELLLSELNDLIAIQNSYIEYMATVDGKVYELNNFFYKAQVEYVVWRRLLQSSADLDIPFTGITSYEKSTVGIWLESYSTTDKKFEKLLASLKKYYKKAFTHAKKVATATTQAKKINQMRRSMGTLSRIPKLFDKVTTFINSTYENFGIQKTSKVQSFTTAADEVTAVLDSLVAQANKEMHASTGEINKARNTAQITLIVVTVVGIAIALALGLVLAFGITKALNSIIDALSQAGEHGDLTKRAEIISQDEVGDMSSWFNTFMDKLEGIIRDVNSSASVLATNSTQLSQTADSFKENAEKTSSGADSAAKIGSEVRSNMESVAAAVEELNISINEIASNAQESASVAGEASTGAQSASATVSDLGESSKEIGQVVNEIVSIAEQTNLLALNATIEAARAGEAGKGFAVVAKEVKDLATQTSELTDTVRNKVKTIQNSTQESVVAIDNITEIINKLNTYSSTIAGAVEEQGATTGEISKNISVAADGARVITDNLTEVVNVAQGTYQVAGDTKQSVDTLASLAADLNKAVTHFKFRDN